MSEKLKIVVAICICCDDDLLNERKKSNYL